MSETTGDYLVEYAEGEKETAMALATNRFMTVEEELPYNILVVSGADEPIEMLDRHDCILSVETEGVGREAASDGE